MRLLVTGGAGFIGSNFIHYMLETYPDIYIVNYDKLTYAGNLDNLKSINDYQRYHFIQGDITDLEKLNTVINTHQIDHIINFAAETHVDRSIYESCKDFVLTNTLGTQMLLDAARSNKIQKMVHVSTDEVYGALELENFSDKFTEKTLIMPNVPYAATKAGGDLMCHAYFITHHVPVVITHCSNNYGPYQFPEKLVPFFIFRLLKNEKVPVHGDGLHVRDWIHVRDHVRALSLLLHQGVPGEVYNIGSDNECSNLELTRMILKILKKDNSMIEYVADRPGNDRRYAIDASKIKALGWKPEYGADKFEQGIRETIEWYKNNTKWMEKSWKCKYELN